MDELLNLKLADETHYRCDLYYYISQQQLSLENMSILTLEDDIFNPTRKYAGDNLCKEKSKLKNKDEKKNDLEVFASDTIQYQFDICKHRERMCDWAYKVLEMHGLNKELASICFSYIDRYLSKVLDAEEILLESEFVLLCITSLYLSIKIHAPSSRILSTSYFVQVCEGNFTQESFNAKEKDILDKLEWKVNPPTAAYFVRFFVDMCLVSDNNCDEQVESCDKRMKDWLLNESYKCTELSVKSSSLISFRKSSIAIASLLLSLEDSSCRTLSLPCCNELFLNLCHNFVSTLQNVTNMQTEAEDVLCIKKELKFLLSTMKFEI